MKIQWVPSLKVKEALAICGSLSNPGKMPCHGYALPAQRCRLGSFLQQLPKAICHYCYALRGRYVFRKVQAAMERRFDSLTDPRWVDAITTLIHRSGDRYFRWHDSGDVQSVDHLVKIIQVCKNLPQVKFWLPTRELLDSVRAKANSCQGSSAVKANTGYGMPSEGTLARRPKKRLNTSMVKSGWMMAHAAPSAVCL